MDHDASTEEIVRALDVDYTEGVPDEAFIAARGRRDEIIPPLIALIRRETELVRSGEDPSPTSGIFGALFLLTEFKANEALPAILESLSLPDDGPFDLYGDILHEHVSGILAELGDEEVVNRLIADRSLNEYVRWQGSKTLLHWVRDGRMTRDAAVDCLRSHLRTALANSDQEGIVGLMNELHAYAPYEAMPEIREVFARNLEDAYGDTLEDYQESHLSPDRLQDSLKRCEPTGCPDALAVVHSWFDDRPPALGPTPTLVNDDEEWSLLDEEFGIGPEERHVEAPRTLLRADVKVGRNDPCPCGSGLKHKKCCGRSS